jgi:hypothetical protein
MVLNAPQRAARALHVRAVALVSTGDSALRKRVSFAFHRAQKSQPLLDASGRFCNGEPALGPLRPLTPLDN